MHLFPELSRLPFPVANEDRADTLSTQLLMVQEIRIGILRLSRFKEIKIQETFCSRVIDCRKGSFDSSALGAINFLCKGITGCVHTDRPGVIADSRGWYHSHLVCVCEFQRS